MMSRIVFGFCSFAHETIPSQLILTVLNCSHPRVTEWTWQISAPEQFLSLVVSRFRGMRPSKTLRHLLNRGISEAEDHHSQVNPSVCLLQAICVRVRSLARAVFSVRLGASRLLQRSHSSMLLEGDLQVLNGEEVVSH